MHETMAAHRSCRVCLASRSNLCTPPQPTSPDLSAIDPAIAEFVSGAMAEAADQDDTSHWMAGAPAADQWEARISGLR